MAFYNRELHAAVRMRNSIESQMYPALRNNEFEMFLQPKFDLHDNSLAGAEALVRWRNPDGSYRSPGEFIPLFEENGFCLKLDMYMFEQACRQIRSWMDEGIEPIPISVNQSKLMFSDLNYPNNLAELMQKYDIPPCLLTIEILEDVAACNVEYLSKQMAALHERGLRISMDDFGSGYSSLNMLCDLSVDELKFDRNFLNREADSEKQKIVVEHVVSAAKKLGIDTVAEGIETQEDLDFVLSMNVDLGQGYFYSKPMDAGSFSAKYMSKKQD